MASANYWIGYYKELPKNAVTTLANYFLLEAITLSRFLMVTDLNFT